MDQWCEEKEKIVWGKRIYKGLSLKQGNSMSLLLCCTCWGTGGRRAWSWPVKKFSFSSEHSSLKVRQIPITNLDKVSKISLSRRLTDHNISSVGEHYYQLVHVHYLLPCDFFIVTSKSLARWKPLVCGQECNSSSFEIERFRFKGPVLKSIITWLYTLGKRKVKKSTLMISSHVSPKPSWLKLYN